MTFAELWRELEPIGRDPGTGGYRRYSWTPADARCHAVPSTRVTLTVHPESYIPAVRFEEGPRDRIASVLAAAGLDAPVLPAGVGHDAPVLPAGAGHDAGILAARVPTAMLSVGNPTGVSHSPAEHADLPDCEAGVRALALVLEDLAARP